eukprot:6036944-Prorocentrum_lima.AAC.1
MLNREGEAHLQLQQSIEAVATELIRVTHITAHHCKGLYNMERATKGLWKVLCQPGLHLWKLNSENKHRTPDQNKLHKS